MEEETPSLNAAQGDGSQGQNGTALGQVETASGQVAAATGQDDDPDFIQSIFSCPITKVRSQIHTCMPHVALFHRGTCFTSYLPLNSKIACPPMHVTVSVHDFVHVTFAGRLTARTGPHARSYLGVCTPDLRGVHMSMKVCKSLKNPHS